MRRDLATAALFSLMAAPLPATAQSEPFPGLGSAAEDRGRVEQVLGNAGTTGFLLRRPRPDLPAANWTLLAPDLDLAWNLALPEARNDGALWAGRGVSARARFGASFVWGRARLVVAPEIAVHQNQAFVTFPSGDAARDPYASPWYIGRNSADLPLRFGDASFATIHPGQSTLSFDAGPLRFVASTANEWWGPGIRNALLLSNHAPGFFRLGIESARPWRTPVGTIEGRWIVGRLAESGYFDADDANDLRSVTGLAVTVAPRETLTLGLARLVVAPLDEVWELPLRAHYVFTRWDRLPDSPGGEPSPSTDALISLFARWLHPAAGVEVYGEWSREEHPTSLREALTAPQQSHAWTLGFQWIERREGDAVIRVQMEATTLEQTRILQDRPVPPSYYTGRAAPQGFTHGGQVLGASIGPGGSSQFLAVDFLDTDWSLGVFASRVRHDNDALYLRPAPDWRRHDVSMSGGLRGSRRLGGYWLSGRVAPGYRMNYLFENDVVYEASFRTLDRFTLATEFTLEAAR